jgi:hypothetical protein
MQKLADLGDVVIQNDAWITISPKSVSFFFSFLQWHNTCEGHATSVWERCWGELDYMTLRMAANFYEPELGMLLR